MAGTIAKHIKLTTIQKLIGKRMLISKSTKPCFYLELKADVTELMGLRPKLKKTLGIKITTNAFYIRALGIAAHKYPVMVGMLEKDSIKIADAINVGFAVNAPQGLVVPVIRNADTKTVSEIAQEEKLLTEKARSNSLTLEEMEAETIALSNLGVYGVDFYGIIPPPASTILGVGNVSRQVCCINNIHELRKKVSLSLAVDHRIINGVYAAQFLTCIKEHLENPNQLL